MLRRNFLLFSSLLLSKNNLLADWGEELSSEDFSEDIDDTANQSLDSQYGLSTEEAYKESYSHLLESLMTPSQRKKGFLNSFNKPILNNQIMFKNRLEYNELFNLLKKEVRNFKSQESRLTSKEIEQFQSKILRADSHFLVTELNNMQTLSNYIKTDKLKIAPNSSILLNFDTTCLEKGVSAPSTDTEPLTLTLRPETKQSQILSLANKYNLSRDKAQHLIWDIQKRKSLKYFNNIEKRIIKKVLPKYNQKGKNGMTKDDYKLINRPASSKIPKNTKLFNEIEIGVLTSVQSLNRHKKAAIGFMNTTDNYIDINPNELIIQTHRKTQPLGILRVSKDTYNENIQNLYDSINILAKTDIISNIKLKKIKETINNSSDYTEIKEALFTLLPNPIKMASDLNGCIGGSFDECTDFALAIAELHPAGKVIKFYNTANDIISIGKGINSMKDIIKFG